MYDWRRMSDVEREALMRERRELKQPMHSPAHRISDGSSRYHITAACYEHRPIIGTSEKRLADFSTALVGTVEAWLTNEQERRHPAAGAIQPPKGGTPTDARIQPAKAGQPGPCLLAWVVMPNHYHLLVSCGDILGLLHELGRLHGRISHLWNGEDGQRGRQIWCKAAETAMKSDRHACVTLNYIHHNPVKHGVCAKWQDWPYSSATAWLERVGHEEATAFWAEYPVKEYGRKWDV
ncbi:MAG: hypothetical protein BWX70_02990 [Verrucomicrobia bacterium ADurb.Bin070]|jgi:putative transposase|nr:MAG: hypothetical protein BWX70_02990 [Verrucomicrobia bacterium ADurb.Bin070]